MATYTSRDQEEGRGYVLVSPDLGYTPESISCRSYWERCQNTRLMLLIAVLQYGALHTYPAAGWLPQLLLY